MNTRTRTIATALLLLAAGCSSSTPQAARPSPSETTNPPASLASVPAKPAPFTSCAAADGHDLTAIAGVTWRAGTATSKGAACHLSLTTATVGGSFDLDYEASSTAQLDVQDRLAGLPKSRKNATVVPLKGLGVGTLAGGVAFASHGGTSYLLYASTKTSVISLVVALPSDVVKQPGDARSLATTARALLTWAIVRQPRQG